MPLAADPRAPTGRAFHRLLARLGSDETSAAGEYESIRKKLIDFFDRRGAPSADVLADETLDRVARKLGEGEEVANVRAYCYGVARYVHMEWRRERAAEGKALAEVAHQTEQRDTTVVEARVACLERCLRALPAESRDLILGYYAGEGKVHLTGRRRLAESLSISYRTMTMRVYRIRLQLEECLRRCLAKSGDL